MLSQPHGHRKIRSTGKHNGLIENQTHDLPACSMVSQPTTLPRTPIDKYTNTQLLAGMVLTCSIRKKPLSYHILGKHLYFIPTMSAVVYANEIIQRLIVFATSFNSP
jgi:hypothetical protein